ncbi:MAG: hypothetical protein PHT69_05240 [Bacteroidales bacterium]|nr:hypothetical protein [Bacteroidales bacterium]
MKRNLFLLIILIVQVELFAQNFEGYYVEDLYKSRRNMQVSTSEYLMDKETLQEYIKKSSEVMSPSESYHIRIFNYTSYFFSLIPKEFLPAECENADCIDWNLKVSLHRSNYDSFHQLFKQKKKLPNGATKAFHIKKVSITIDSLGAISDLRQKGFDIEFLYVARGRGVAPNNSENNVLLRWIHSQSVLTEEDIAELGLSEYLEPMCEIEANNEFHPNTPSIFDNKGKKKRFRRKAFFRCLCNSQKPSDW